MVLRKEVDMEALVTLLTRERLLAELVVFKLVELRQVLLAGEARFLPWAAEEVERATASLRRTELERAVLVSGLVQERGLPEDTRLRDLAADAAEPWRGMLDEQADDLRRLCTEASDLLQVVRRLADTGLRGITDLLGRTAAEDPDDGLVLYGRTRPAGQRAAAPRRAEPVSRR